MRAGHRAAGARTRPTRGGATRCRACERTREGLRFVAPAVDMSIHLPWLAARLRALGGTIERRDGRLARRARGRRRRQLRGPGRARAGRRPVADRGARPGRARDGARRATSGCSTSPTRSGSSTSCRASDDVVLGGTAQEGAEDLHARPGDDRGDPRALRRARPRSARRAGGRRRRRPAARAPGGAPGGRGPRRALLRPRRRGRDPRLGLRWGGSRTSRRRRPALRCPAVK